MHDADGGGELGQSVSDNPGDFGMLKRPADQSARGFGAISISLMRFEQTVTDVCHTALGGALKSNIAEQGARIPADTKPQVPASLIRADFSIADNKNRCDCSSFNGGGQAAGRGTSSIEANAGKLFISARANSTVAEISSRRGVNNCRPGGFLVAAIAERTSAKVRSARMLWR